MLCKLLHSANELPMSAELVAAAVASPSFMSSGCYICR